MEKLLDSQLGNIQGGRFSGSNWTSCSAVSNGAGGTLYCWACCDYYVLWINTMQQCDAYSSSNGNQGVCLMP